MRLIPWDNADGTIKPCVRCGFCCKQVTCALGVLHGEDPYGHCSFLEGERPGEYVCALIRDNPDLGPNVAVGGGCSSTLFNEDRREALRGHDSRRDTGGPVGGSST